MSGNRLVGLSSKTAFPVLFIPSQKETFIAGLKVGQCLEGEVLKELGGQRFLINFSGIEVVAESPVALEAGQEIQVRVLHTHPQVVVSLVRKVGSEPEQLTTLNLAKEPFFDKHLVLLLSPSAKETFIAGLKVGQCLEGEVLKELGGQRFLINFSGIEVVAESPVALEAGQEIQVRVLHTQPQVVVSLVGEPSSEKKALSLLRSYLPVKIEWGELVQSLSRIFTGKVGYQLEMIVGKELKDALDSCLSSLVFRGSEVNEKGFLRQFIERSGLLHEAELIPYLLEGKKVIEGDSHVAMRNLKGLLLELSHRIESYLLKAGVQNGEMGGIWSMVRAAVKSIEVHQLLNFLTGRIDQQLVFQIPFALPEGIRTAELYVRWDGQRGMKRGGRHDDVYIVFLLGMRGLGKVRIDTWIMKKRLRLTVQVEKEEVAFFINKHLPELVKRFGDQGFRVEKLVCRVSDPPVPSPEVPLGGFSLLELRLLDIRI